MEDFKLILYVLAAVAYFVFMQWRKAFNSPKEDIDPKAPKPERRQQHPAKPVTSFDDILRELQPKLEQAEAKGKKVVAEAKEIAKPFVPPLIPQVEKIPMPKQYTDRAPKALSWEKAAEAKQLAKLSEELRIKDRFESYDRQKAAPNPYASLLKNPKTVREAVVLTEILKRKYD